MFDRANRHRGPPGCGDRFTRKVVGWRNALRHRDEMVSALRNGSLRVARVH
jgi:hypothetical protein